MEFLAKLYHVQMFSLPFAFYQIKKLKKSQQRQQVLILLYLIIYVQTKQQQ